MAQPKIFVSHSHDDNDFAEKLVKDLNAAGSNSWLDKNELGAGDFQARINKALADCKWFVLVLSRNAVASPWVQQEVNAANARKHLRQIQNLIFIQAGPIRHDELPPLWQVYNIYDARADYQGALNRALKDIGLQPSSATDLPASARVEPKWRAQSLHPFPPEPAKLDPGWNSAPSATESPVLVSREPTILPRQLSPMQQARERVERWYISPDRQPLDISTCRNWSRTEQNARKFRAELLIQRGDIVVLDSVFRRLFEPNLAAQIGVVVSANAKTAKVQWYIHSEIKWGESQSVSTDQLILANV